MTTPWLVPSPTGGFLGTPLTTQRAASPAPIPAVVPNSSRGQRLPRDQADGPSPLVLVTPRLRHEPAPNKRAEPTISPLINPNSQVYLSLKVLAKYKDTITVEEWAVACWKAHPQEFCLRGFPEHPNNHRVRALASKLMTRAWVICANNKVCISKLGMQVVKMLAKKAKPNHE